MTCKLDLNNIRTRISGDQIIMTDDTYLISKNKNSTYITYIGDNNGPEKVLLNIHEKGYYEISYNQTDGITYRKVPKPVRDNKNK
jgi:hypothetical protein